MPTYNTIGVTGASGFIASHVIADLLAHGYTVRGTVRSTVNLEKYSYLTTLPGADERLSLYAADLGEPGSFDAALTGCDAVMHIASPYVLDAQDPQRDLVDPAVNGTRNMLQSCVAAGTVRRVVVTSSMAAISDEPLPDHVFTEADWNDKSSLSRNPYYYSKVKGERAAWSFVEDNETSFDLVVVNPYTVIGPSLGPGLNTSNEVIYNLMSGGFPAILGLDWGLVDVRDVATAHRLAMEKRNATGRFLCANSSMSMTQIANLLKRNGYDRYKIPSFNVSSNLGNAMMRLLSHFQGEGTGSYLRTHLGKTMRYSNAKIKRELGLTFMPVEQTVLDTAADLVKWGHVKPKR